MVKKILRRVAALVAVALVSGLAVQGVMAAASVYPRVRASVVEFFSSTGTRRWMANLDSSNNFQLVENSNIGAPVLSVKSTTGGLAPRSRTLAQILAITPAAEGEILWNSSGDTLCVSSGTTPGAWIVLAAGDSVKIACK